MINNHQCVFKLRNHYMKKENQRVKLTKKLLKQSLLELMNKKPVGDITVIELCEKAEINRSTFYNHYGCPNDVLYDIECDFVEDLEQIWSKNQDKEYPIEKRAENLCTYLMENKKLAQLLLKESYTSEFSKLLFQASHVKNCYEKMFDEIPDKQSRQLLIAFVKSGTYNMIREWINSENPISPKQMGELTKIMSSNSFENQLKKIFSA